MLGGIVYLVGNEPLGNITSLAYCIIYSFVINPFNKHPLLDFRPPIPK